jgi:hypothetical protein
MSSASLPPLVQENGLPFDVFIQSLTEQLDRAQAAMAIKARVAKLPMTFAVKDLSLDLRAFVNVVDDDLYIRPAGPGDAEASTLRLALTTITRPMIEENAVDFHTAAPKFNLKEALGDSLSDEDQRRLERIGINTVQQLNDLKRTAGADVIARLSRLPVNRLQQALLRAAAPHITQVESHPAPPAADDSMRASFTNGDTPYGAIGGHSDRSIGGPILDRLGGSAAGASAPQPVRTHLRGINLLQNGRLPLIRAGGRDVPVVMAQDHELVIEPHPSQFGHDAELRFGDGSVLSVRLPSAPTQAGAAS